LPGSTRQQRHRTRGSSAWTTGSSPGGDELPSAPNIAKQPELLRKPDQIGP
jgi:hypothetical protein